MSITSKNMIILFVHSMHFVASSLTKSPKLSLIQTTEPLPACSGNGIIYFNTVQCALSRYERSDVRTCKLSGALEKFYLDALPGAIND